VIIGWGQVLVNSQILD